jgi:hypothetical protein
MALEHLNRMLVEFSLLRFYSRTASFILKTPKERYDDLVKSKSPILQKATQYHRFGGYYFAKGSALRNARVAIKGDDTRNHNPGNDSFAFFYLFHLKPSQGGFNGRPIKSLFLFLN